MEFSELREREDFFEALSRRGSNNSLAMGEDDANASRPASRRANTAAR